MSELTPITRVESYLDAIVNNGIPPTEDITRIETFLQAIYDNQVCALTPITRIEMFLGKISGQNIVLPEPITRIELYLAAIAGEDVELPENPITRLEMYLAEWADSGDWTTISGAIVEFITQRAHKLKSCVVSLSPQQDLHGYDAPWPPGGGVNKANLTGATAQSSTAGLTTTIDVENEIITISGTYTGSSTVASFRFLNAPNIPTNLNYKAYEITSGDHLLYTGVRFSENDVFAVDLKNLVPNTATNIKFRMVAYEGTTAPSSWTPYSNICPISGRTECEVTRTGKNLLFEYLPISNVFGMVVSKIQDSNGGVRLSGVPNWSTGTVSFRVMWAGAVKGKFNNIASVKAFCNSPYLNIRDAYFGENDTSIVVLGDVTATTNNITVDIYVVVYMGEEPIEFIPYNGNSYSVTFPSVNVWDEEWENGMFDTTTGANIDSGGALNQIRAKNLIPVNPDTDYYFKVPNELDITGGAWVIFYDAEETVITSGLPSGKGSSGNSRMFNNSAFKTPSNAQYIRFYMTIGYGNTYNHDISINYPSIITDYYAYGELLTVYGGTPDIVSGEMPVTMRYIVIDGNSDIGKESTGWAGNYEAFYLLINPYRGEAVNTSVTANIVTNQLKATSYQGLRTGNDPFVISFTDNAKYLEWGSTSATLEEEKARLAQNPIQVAYELATPVTIQLTPQQVTTLLGQNNIWANGDSVEAEYCADTKRYIDKKLAALVAALS